MEAISRDDRFEFLGEILEKVDVLQCSPSVGEVLAEAIRIVDIIITSGLNAQSIARLKAAITPHLGKEAKLTHTPWEKLFYGAAMGFTAMLKSVLYSKPIHSTYLKLVEQRVNQVSQDELYTAFLFAAQINIAISIMEEGIQSEIVRDKLKMLDEKIRVLSQFLRTPLDEVVFGYTSIYGLAITTIRGMNPRPFIKDPLPSNRASEQAEGREADGASNVFNKAGENLATVDVQVKKKLVNSVPDEPMGFDAPYANDAMKPPEQSVALILEATRRLELCRDPTQDPFVVYPNLGEDPQQMLADFCALALNAPSVAAVMEHGIYTQFEKLKTLDHYCAPVESDRRMRCGDDPDLHTIYHLMEYFNKLYVNRSFRRLPKLYYHSSAPTSEEALLELLRLGVTQPSIFSFGSDNRTFYVYLLTGNTTRQIRVFGGFKEAMLSLIAIHYIIDAKFDLEVSDVLSFFWCWLGLKTTRLTKQVRETIKLINV